MHGCRHPESRKHETEGAHAAGTGGLLPPASEREARMDDPDARLALAGQTVHLAGGSLQSIVGSLHCKFHSLSLS